MYLILPILNHGYTIHKIGDCRLHRDGARQGAGGDLQGWGGLRRVWDSRVLQLEANLVFISLLNLVSLGSFLKPSITIPVIVTNICLSFVSTVVTFMVPDLLDWVQKLVVRDADDSLVFLKSAHETASDGCAEVVLHGA